MEGKSHLAVTSCLDTHMPSDHVAHGHSYVHVQTPENLQSVKVNPSKTSQILAQLSTSFLFFLALDKIKVVCDN